MNCTLKKIGKFDLCLDEDDLHLLDELDKFRAPLRDLTRLVSECSQNLSFVPLMITKDKKRIC